MKWQIIIILLLCFTQVSAEIIVQWSDDNATWSNATHTDETIRKSLTAGLQSNTEYYFRAREDTGVWSYFTQRTKDEINNVTYAIVLGIGMVAFIFLYLAFNLNEEHYILKLILIFFTIITVILIPTALIEKTAFENSTFLKVTLWFFRIFVIYFTVYLFYYWAKRSEWFINLINQLKR